MSQPAAALGDPAAHGGTIATGSPNVFIGGRMAARVGDSAACPIHGTGVIAQGSATVFINGMAAARMLDMTGCLITPAPPIIHHYSPVDEEGQTVADFDAKGGQMIAYAEHAQTDSNSDGKLDTDDYSAAALRYKNVSDTTQIGSRSLTGDQEYDLLYGSAKVGQTVVTNEVFSTANNAEFAAIKATASNTYGKPNDGKNAAAKVSGTVQVAHAELKANAFQGENEEMVGTKVEFGAGYETLKGEVAATGTSISVNGYNLQVTAKGSGSVESVGASAGAGLYYHKKEKRLYMALDIGLEIFLGLEGAFEVSVGEEYKPDTLAPGSNSPSPSIPGVGGAGIPGTILLGNLQVFIG